MSAAVDVAATKAMEWGVNVVMNMTVAAAISFAIALAMTVTVGSWPI